MAHSGPSRRGSARSVVQNATTMRRGKNRTVISNENNWKRVLESGRFSGRNGLRPRSGDSNPVAFDPSQTWLDDGSVMSAVGGTPEVVSEETNRRDRPKAATWN